MSKSVFNSITESCPPLGIVIVIVSKSYLIFPSVFRDLLVHNVVHHLESFHGLLLSDTNVLLLEWHRSEADKGEECHEFEFSRNN